ncbi:hypothetical protein A2U01_0094850, partial [Trifolium medium]|nr:hypothetical protein [Trifolium medium]
MGVGSEQDHWIVISSRIVGSSYRAGALARYAEQKRIWASS